MDINQIQKIKIEQIKSNKGYPVANQFILTLDDCTIFNSYGKNIALIDNNGTIYIDETYYDYSRTTGKYRNYFLGIDLKETRRRIKYGDIIMTNLNDG